MISGAHLDVVDSNSAAQRTGEQCCVLYGMHAYTYLMYAYLRHVYVHRFARNVQIRQRSGKNALPVEYRQRGNMHLCMMYLVFLAHAHSLTHSLNRALMQVSKLSRRGSPKDEYNSPGRSVLWICCSDIRCHPNAAIMPHSTVSFQNYAE